MSFVYGASASLGWGLGDFFGGAAARKSDSFVVAAIAEVSGLVLVLVLIGFVGGDPSMTDLVWGCLAGLAGVAGLATFFRLLAMPGSARLAPVTGVVALAAAVLFGLVDGERPSLPGLVGLLIALVAVGLLGFERSDGHAPLTIGSGALVAIVCGLLFGAYDILLSRIGAGAGLVPIAAARLTGFLAAGAVVLVARRPRAVGGSAVVMAAGAGLLDVSGAMAFFAATSTGLLTLVAPLASLYPVVTLAASVAVFREMPNRAQYAGIALSIVCLLLIASG